jgi:hypothetical protein
MKSSAHIPIVYLLQRTLNSFLFSFVTFKTNSSIHSQQNVILTESRILIGKQTSPIIQYGLNSHIVHGNAFSNLSVRKIGNPNNLKF